MDEVETAAIVLAALEVVPSARADLTPFVLDGSINELKNGASGETISPLFDYVRSNVDSRRIRFWSELLIRDVVEMDEYAPLLVGRPGFPTRLGRMWDAPPVLFTRGALPDDDVRSVAIVGSRNTTTEVLEKARETSAVLASNGVHIVSGLALGVDAAVHRGALAVAGRTSAVLGTGIQTIYPACHSDLARNIVGSGAVVSEFPPYAPRSRSSFLRRNGTIAAMTDALVVMDAGNISGSRQAVQRAVEYGRKVLIWRPALGQDEWAQHLVTLHRASFFNESIEVLDAITAVDPCE